MKKIILFTSLILSAAAFAAPKSADALKFVPGGEVLSSKNNEFIVKTKQGTQVEVELNNDGTLDEASGNLAQKDEFVPGMGLLSLADAVKAMKKAGKEVQGEWSLDKDMLRDWEYEFEGFENGKSFEYTMNAKTGELVKSEAD